MILEIEFLYSDIKALYIDKSKIFCIKNNFDENKDNTTFLF